MMRIWMVLILFLCLANAASRAQTHQAASPAQSTADTNTDNSEEPDAPVDEDLRRWTTATWSPGQIALGRC